MFQRWFLADFWHHAWIAFIAIIFLVRSTAADVVSITSGNIDDILGSNELAFINFYADWCRFSQMLTPVFDETWKKVSEEFPEHGRVILGRVDCDREGGIASKYQVNKYPTLKLFRYGQPVKKEYRGQRTAEAMKEFIKKQLENPIQLVANLNQLERLDVKKRNVIGYFESEDSHEYKAFFLKVASYLRDDCTFYAALGPISASERTNGDKVVFKAFGDKYHPERIYPGSLTDYDTLQQWTWEMCVPLVREITFENAEELTEEALPFMILFHHPDDLDTPARYKKQVALELTKQQYAVNFLTADGLKFNHPLHHLGKSADDLPVLAIDSFRHMYVWKHNVKADIDKPGLLQEFIQDLQSGKLHREFHHGPDPTTAPQQLEETKPAAGEHNSLGHIPKDVDDSDTVTQQHGGGASEHTTPPESLFIKLGPSPNRYTILRDEL